MTNPRSLDYYDRAEIWSSDSNYGKEAEAARARLVADLVTSTRPNRVLDVGAGNGLVSNELLARGVDVVALDFSEVALESVLGAAVVGNVDELPFDNDSYETVVLSEVLEHLNVEEYQRGLAEVARVASETVIVTVPNDEDLLANGIVCPDCQCRSSPHRHVRSFSPRSLTKLLPGFAPERIFGFGPQDVRATRLEALVRREVLRRWQWVDTAICPQCGFQSSPDGPAPRTHAAETIKARLARPLRRRKPRWLAAVLRKT